MISLFSRKRASSLALALALASGTAVTVSAVVPAEANAQRNRDRDREKAAEESDGGGYTDAFRAAYAPLDEALKAEGANAAALRPQIDALIPLLTTNDEKIAGGGLVFNAGLAASDRGLQLQGMEIMLSSGKVPIDQIARYNFIAYQLANEQRDYAKARRYLQGAIDNNFSTETVSAPDLQIAMAESYFASNELQQGFAYLERAISGRKAQGLEVEEQWYRRGVTVAYENEAVPTVYEFTSMWISEFPTAANWRDAVNLTRNLNTFQPGEILDLFRLGRKVGALQDASDYDYYVEAADARRLPKEVKDVIEEGYANQIISRDNLFITEALEIASGRIAADRADLPALERDAMAGDAALRTVMAAGSAFLSYGDYAKAATFYQRALGMPGVDTAEAQTRLGIAQVGMGDYEAARATFNQVTGSRTPIAKLWVAYVNEREAASTPAPAPAAAAPATIG
ncbi:tetratricopeptide repeat protein [Qipengyuania sp. ASV99]|uniref:tetratricopeptide repeat protein n=1 Tax=Qipengyuania sp. ASV99 TaxID=3399681 RepID=UPI003A4C72BD